ncbi:MAG: CBS domain-containing protein, partial [Thermoanaerobaculia bacterium]|nr:CBS domain-containing protein [Thermoanaerobaculia bacterium]
MRELVAKDVMNTELIKVRDDMTVAELAQFLVENEVSGVPVEDVEGRLVGVVSLSDVARSLTGRDEAVMTHTDTDYYLQSWQERFNAEDIAGLRIAESDETVGEIMTPSILAVDEEMPIGKVAGKMIDAR